MEERMYLGEAPTFRPTEKEFADPIKYIQSIRPIALEYGICKIVPPGPPERLQGPRRRGFKETVARHLDTINPHAFQFKTKLQKIHQLQSRYGPNETFVTDLQKFLEGRGTPMKSVPRVDGKELDLYKLFKIVMERGGNKKVTEAQQWVEVATALKFSSNLADVAEAISQHYTNLLAAYERRYKRRLSQSPEAKTSSRKRPREEGGGSSPPSQGESLSVPSSSSSSSASGAASGRYSSFSCRRCSKMVNNNEEAIREHLDFHYARDMANGCTTPSANPKSIVPRYVTVAEGGGPTTTAAPPTAAAPPSDAAPAAAATTPTRSNNGSNKRRKHIAISVPLFNSPNVSPLTFALDLNAKKTENTGEATTVGKTRGRKKKDDSMDVESIMCIVCGGGEDEDKMLLCDSKGCENAYHMYCLKKPLSSIPSGDWYCDECVEERKEKECAGGKGKAEEDDYREEFGFGEGKIFTLDQYKKMANNFKKKWFLVDRGKNVSVDEVEKEFWRIVNASEEYVQVHYGSDIDTRESKVSGFPSPLEVPELDSGWNLKLLAKVPNSPLRYIPYEFPGVTIPMLYVGMLFSSFCWHTEDNYLYSINYLHKGATKSWYGVPGTGAANFETVMKLAVPDLFEENPDLLHHLTTMLCPSVLMASGVPIYHLTQNEGDFVVTFPQAYHAGINHGFNIAESVNFSTPDWLPYGRKAMARYRQIKRGVVFSHQELVCEAVMKPPEALEIGLRLKYEFVKMQEEEQVLRDKILLEGVETCMRMPKGEENKDDENKQCVQCMADCYLSAIMCPCRPNDVACLRHSKKLCSCPGKKKILVIRYTLSELDSLLNAFQEGLQKFQ